jgi:hypothetical protein
MTTFEPAAAPLSPKFSAALLRLAPALFAATLFVSALLLFAVQPMFTKMLLPRLGGAPAVWSVAIVVFQAALLAGYAYAHLLARTLAPGLAALAHLAFLAAASASLPIGISSSFGVPPESGVVLWLVVVIAGSIGLPFVALSASAPLLQSWFAASGQPQARNPYVLYAASNLGSFAALLAYPFVLEPLMSLRTQATAWSLGYAVLAVLVAVAGLLATQGARARRAAPEAIGPAPSLIDRSAWIALAAIPSGLVVAVTAHMTTDIAAAPFLWVVPLALYLLTFVALFRDRPWIDSSTAAKLTPFAVAPLAAGVLGDFWFAANVLNLVVFLLLALVCHGELYRRRPAPQRLTEFYLWTSFGGVLGGVFAGLLAPNIFSGTYEYQVLIVAALIALPGRWADGWTHIVRVASLTAAVVAALVIARIIFPSVSAAWLSLQIGLIVIGTLMLLLRERPAELAALAVVAFVVVELWRPGHVRVETARSFFGVHRVMDVADGQFRLLHHGTTIHGAERVREPDGTLTAGRPQPRTYYYFGGPISEGIAAARAAQGRLARVAAVGLGTGSLACHQHAGENWTFFEIDPQVVRIARDRRLFHFLSACAPDVPIVLGDARLTLAASPDIYDLIVLDAFSSDSIPVHLLTHEAFAGYLSRLGPRGVIVVHISNRHLELGRVVAAVAATHDLLTLVKHDVSVTDPLQDWHANASVAVMARKVEDFADLPTKPGWRWSGPSGIAPWTDDYSDILGALLRKKL